MNSPRVFLAISALLLAGQASAAQSDCSGVMWSNANEISSAKVIATDARIYFVANQSARTPMCPSPDRACRLRGFLVPGDDVLVTATSGAYLCATFKSPKGVETSGWLPKAAVVVVAPKNLSAQDWDGEWRRDSEAEVILRSHGNELEISGAATWIGEATANEGQLTGNAEPRNGSLAIGYDPDKPGSSPLDGPGCAARLQLFGRYLVVDDNDKCGGLNVSFSGIYVRHSGK